ncbi:MAG: hypothetical protein R3F59_20840 [Myxococcota bacterium]
MLLLWALPAIAADHTYDLDLRIYCVEGFDNCDAAAADPIVWHDAQQIVGRLNVLWEPTSVSFHLASIASVNDPAYFSFFDPLAQQLMLQASQQSPASIVLHYEPYTLPGYTSSTPDPYALSNPPYAVFPGPQNSYVWAHALGHAFCLDDTASYQDPVDVGGGEPNHDGDGLTDTLPDPGSWESPNPGHHVFGDDNGPGHDWCEVSSYPLDDTGEAYCAASCVRDWAPIPYTVQPELVMSTLGLTCEPYVLQGQLHPAFTPQQVTRVHDCIQNVDQLIALTEHCAGDADTDSDGFCGRGRLSVRCGRAQ